ncbi:hypothetical protein [Nonomuraea sp. MG754425]|uniref:hypothetical protein n=1 Tax=Nonomuraea sp. MG754425 TaxID=2570319 RepID=UPI001F2F6594|nr:hypothetical protein [Nonomuraea sp. MG754425]
MPDRPRAAIWNADRIRPVAVVEGHNLTAADIDAARRLAGHPNIHHRHTTFQE